MGMLCNYQSTDALLQLLEGLPKSPPPSMKLHFKMFSLKLSSKPCLEEVDDVGHCHMRADVPEDFSRSSLETSSEIVKHVLVIPPQVTGHALERRQERVQSPKTVILL